CRPQEEVEGFFSPPEEQWFCESPRLEGDARRSQLLEGGACWSPRPEVENCRSPRPEDGVACRSPRPDGEACRSPRPDGEACRSPRPDGEACRSPRPEDGEACRSPRPEDGEACLSPRPEDGEACRSPRPEDGEACRSPRPEDGEACRSPRPEDGEACRSPRPEDGEACRSPRPEDGEACRSPRPEDGEACRSPRPEDGVACRSPRPEDGVACRSPRPEHGVACRSPRPEHGVACRSPRPDGEACRSPRPDGEVCRSPRLDGDEPKDSLSGAETAQVIQVTVTLTEGPESPQRSATITRVSLVTSQSPPSPENGDQQELEISNSLLPGKEERPEKESAVNVGDEESEESKITLAVHTKEIFSDPSEETTQEVPVDKVEPMDVTAVEMAPSMLEQASLEAGAEENVLEQPTEGGPDAVAEKEVRKSPKELQDQEKELTLTTFDGGEDVAQTVSEEVDVLPSSVLSVEEIINTELGSLPGLLDLEDTVEMDTTPASDHSSLDFGSQRAEDIPTQASFGMSPELSVMLSQSPFSTEASPREASPPGVQVQNPARSRSGYSASVPITTTTFIPLTPKIGMGKPAISKRKFSPGRPRVKQGAWSNPRAASPPSWSQQEPSEGGWDSPKTRHLQEAPVWSMR
ncbi:hypothetical protein DPEC_G00077460, partial [Dallia pectoralis]